MIWYKCQISNYGICLLNRFQNFSYLPSRHADHLQNSWKIASLLFNPSQSINIINTYLILLPIILVSKAFGFLRACVTWRESSSDIYWGQRSSCCRFNLLHKVHHDLVPKFGNYPLRIFSPFSDLSNSAKHEFIIALSILKIIRSLLDFNLKSIPQTQIELKQGLNRVLGGFPIKIITQISNIFIPWK